ncbi:CBS domain-containing protein [Yinghuangia aomiensis]
MAPDEPADQVLTALTSGSHAALVLDDGRLVGMVTHDDIARLQHHAALRGRPAEPPAAVTGASPERLPIATGKRAAPRGRIRRSGASRGCAWP